MMHVSFQVILFCLGFYWFYDLWPKIPRLEKEARGFNPKVERWPAILVLGLSAYYLLWMIRFGWNWITMVVRAVG